MNKIYMKTVFALLSLFVYASNKSIASDPFLRKPTSDNIISTFPNGISEDIYKQNEELICTNTEETKKAEEIMKDAVTILQKHAQNEEDYSLYHKYDEGANVYFKKHEDTDIGKLELKIRSPDNYNDIVKILWDPNGAKHFDVNFINGKIVRIYNPNLVMVQFRSRSLVGLAQEYLYALAHKVEISENETIIVHASADINDHNDTYEYSYRNTILKSANSFQTEIDSEDDIVKGEIIKTYINLSGCIIKKEDEYVNLTCLNSIDVEFPNMKDLILKVVKSAKMATLANLRATFENN
ncbi:fam-a protein [Plasmodium berghei]|uniref:Fam-a protein n=2 Tax=Plasmodium berghei TaxID=5821 RepID=A0A509AIT2_PLABA|nr:fam-a protein [Plasmodium berghei ANKA]CXI14826.1 fam-a protein [Plasmodium berghei]SCM19532.1 fam-a protein [Plasmodium berghei]SCO58994.1 fam-a protein [Plasmodium berghei]SCO59491.1 fam-a protein [Plasmodium berghei]VUC54680.1 fam-a protein [Plasmodium berghei ANKA]|eukprot:XP_034420505.1 fam-a protein [Plasmodium berghei ANKA]